jgi:hypothetical protein
MWGRREEREKQRGREREREREREGVGNGVHKVGLILYRWQKCMH